MATLQDRIRIPWRGGAKQVSADNLLPLILIPLLITLAAFDQLITIVTFILLPFFMNHISNWFQTNHPRTKFFVVWSIVSFITLALIFQIKVIGLLEILPEENIGLALCTFISFAFVYLVRLRASKPKSGILMEAEENGVAVGEETCVTCRRKISDRMYHCHICQTCIPEHDFHFSWYDCCIGQNNNGLFILSVLFSIISLLYSSNLTLTTVCHPFTVFGTVMLPDDCSEVYEQYDMSICFVSALYSIWMALYLLWVLFRHCLFVCLGITGHEWQQMSPVSRLLCGVWSSRPYSEGIVRNWCKLFKCKDKNRYSGVAYAET